jgi:Ca2+-binding EF-hand superfamily protein
MIGNESNEEEIRSIIQNIDYKGNGKINYSEFIAATL